MLNGVASINSSMANGEKSLRQRITNFFNNALYVSLVLTFSIFILLAVFSFLRSDWVGNWKPILDIQLIVSIWVAELPIAYFVKYILGERVDRPVLSILDEPIRRIGQSELEPTYFGVTVWNKGDIIAQDCDVAVAISGSPEFAISWQPARTEAVNIRPDRRAMTEILRIMPLERTLEFPSDKGWDLPKMQLAFKDYEGVVSIGAANCKPAKHDFKIAFDEKTNKVDIKLVPSRLTSL